MRCTNSCNTIHFQTLSESFEIQTFNVPPFQNVRRVKCMQSIYLFISLSKCHQRDEDDTVGGKKSAQLRHLTDCTLPPFINEMG